MPPGAAVRSTDERDTTPANRECTPSGPARRSAASAPSSATSRPAWRGRDPPAVEPAVDELRGPESPSRARGPGIVVALAEHQPAALRAAGDGDVARAASGVRSPSGRPTRRGGRARRRRRRARPGRPGARIRRRVVSRWVPAAGPRSAGAQDGVDGPPASRSAVAAVMLTGTGVAVERHESSRQPVSTRPGTGCGRRRRSRRWPPAARPARRSGGRA